MPMYSSIKEEFTESLGAANWEILSTFWENTGHFSIGNGAEIGHQKQPWHPQIMYLVALTPA